MITAHEYSAAYVKAQQQAEPLKLGHHESYEPHCLMAWKTSVAAMDEMVALLGKPSSTPSKEHA